MEYVLRLCFHEGDLMFFLLLLNILCLFKLISVVHFIFFTTLRGCCQLNTRSQGPAFISTRESQICL